MTDELRSKTVVVTGGSRGLGRAMAHSFAAHGANLVIASRNYEACADVARELEAQYGVTTVPVRFNAAEWSHCEDLVKATLEAFGTIDVLINNAGSSPLYPSLEEVSEALFDKVVAVNLRAPFRLMALTGNAMSEAGGGTVVNIGSMESTHPRPHALPYAAAKSGLYTLTRGFAAALAPHVRVNMIQPGAFATDIAAHWDDMTVDLLTSRSALSRVGSPDEITGAAVYLATSASSFVTGSLLSVDGGAWII